MYGFPGFLAGAHDSCGDEYGGHWLGFVVGLDGGLGCNCGSMLYVVSFPTHACSEVRNMDSDEWVAQVG